MTEQDEMLIQGYLDETLTSEEFARLQVRLREDSNVRRRLRDLATVDSKLQSWVAGNLWVAQPLTTQGPLSHESLRSIEESSQIVDLNRPIVHGRWKSWLTLAVAALILLATGLSMWWSMPASVEAEILAISGSNPFHWSEGSHVRFNQLNLTEGTIKMRLKSGVTLDIVAPVKMQLADAMQLRLKQGHVTVDAGDHGDGFVVETPHARVVDLGTQFGVDANPTEKTDVVVFQGSVELFDRASEPTRQRLVRRIVEGQAIRVDADYAMTRIVNVIGGTQSREWSTQAPPSECRILQVTDNFARDDDWFFYRIIPQGLSAGTIAFSNRPHTWEPVDGHKFPESLEGADLVQTFRGARKKERIELQVHIQGPAKLYLLMPKRGLPPEWLTDRFTRTGEELVIHESDARPWVRLPVEVWQLEIIESQIVTLGPASRDENGNPTAMYGIAAKGN